MSGRSIAEAVAGWAPAPVEVTEVLGPDPARAFAGILDQPSPVEGPGAMLPPGWQAFYFLERPAQAELGGDGHLDGGGFIPPIPNRRRMFAGGRWRAAGRLPIGAAVTRRSEVVRIEPKVGRSGEMLFVTVRQTFHDPARQLLIDEEQDFVYRQEDADGPRPTPPPPTDATPGPGAWRVELATDPTVLFRFSALTYNSHRIHYDQPYVTGVEGFPGLVVHGPLLALLLLELPRRYAPDRPVGACSYRLQRPAFSGPPIVASGDPDGAELQVASVGAPASAVATVELT